MACTCSLLVSTFLFAAVLGINGGANGNTIEFKKSLDDQSKRQSDFFCTNDTSCYPENVDDVPPNLIYCDIETGTCMCKECFELGEDGMCTVDSCYDWDNGECDDKRDSQLVAFLLSFFLSGVGAANFYIGQYGLASGQLVIFLITIFVGCCAGCIPCCIACCIMSGDEVKGSIFAICFFTIVFIIVLAGSLAMFAWWIADLVIFATNERDSGNGCPLRPFSET